MQTSGVLVRTAGDNPIGVAIEMMQNMLLATCMGTHARLGCKSLLWLLDAEILRDQICVGLRVMSLSQVYTGTGLQWLVVVRECQVPFPLMQACTVVDFVHVEPESFVLQVCTQSVDLNEKNERLKWEVSVWFDDIAVVAGGGKNLDIPTSAMRVKTNAVEMQESFNLSDDAVKLMVSPLWGVIVGDTGREIMMQGGMWGLYCMKMGLEPARGGIEMSSRLGLYVQNMELLPTEDNDYQFLYALQEEEE
jgi:hypothetical protein